jgi:hypothetical protein
MAVHQEAVREAVEGEDVEDEVNAEDEVNFEDDTELEEEEENLPALHETLAERSHREFWDARERLPHIKQIRKYKNGLISHDELSPTPIRYLRIIPKRKAVILSLEGTTRL